MAEVATKKGVAGLARTEAKPHSGRRCAIYTRKSSDEGLEQSFNSLDAQREACEAYIASQKHEGWILYDAAYDDGGLSGGSMDRPALQRLLDDIRSGLIDIVVVYKVDRLTRSLADFAKLTELFDAHGASFVSVTQAFNTSTSMGRLTLNVLLSFAQFEREVAGERIRDKIALSKQRGMWMGGLPPLGYDARDRTLVVNEAEAETVRTIFEAYNEIGTLADLKRHLDARGIVSKRRTFANGTTRGGVPISRGALYQILRNPIYRGQIPHKGRLYPGNHQAIISAELWEAVQSRLIAQSQRPRFGAIPRGGTAANQDHNGQMEIVADAGACDATGTGAPSRVNRHHASMGSHLSGDGLATQGITTAASAEESSTGNAGPDHCQPVHSATGCNTVTGSQGSAIAATPVSDDDRCSWLAGRVFDADGHRLTPTSTHKKRKRYRYYVTAKSVRGEKPSRTIRVPKRVLEDLVRQTLANHLADPIWESGILGSTTAPEDVAAAVETAQALATQVRALDALDGDGNSGQAEEVWTGLLPLIDQVAVGERTVEIVLRLPALWQAVGLDIQPREAEPTADQMITLTVDAQPLRCGKQVKLILGTVDSAQPRPDPDLIALVTSAYRWFDDLKTGRCSSIAELARRYHQHVPEVSRSISLAFLAPDIVEMILKGHQPPTLTVERLRATRPLPLDWDEQRTLLLG
jgi:DNA invertase Pin-like site-specific DNA recombinase